MGLNSASGVGDGGKDKNNQVNSSKNDQHCVDCRETVKFALSCPRPKMTWICPKCLQYHVGYCDYKHYYDFLSLYKAYTINAKGSTSSQKEK